MKASETQLLKFMNQRDQQFVVPIFQRNYSWSDKECSQLLDDICRVAQDDAEQHHFVGSVIYILEDIFHSSSIQRLLVIDGQQRLTTISLLLLALANAEENGQVDNRFRDRVYDRYLLNTEQPEGDDSRYKLWLARGDRTAFCNLIDCTAEIEQSSHRIIENYNWFRRQVAATTIDVQTLYHGISKLLIVDVSLKRGQDDPQRIFESMNTTGLDLFEGDKVRNFVLMKLRPDEQERLYNRSWFPMERRFDPASTQNEIDFFIRDYLTTRTGVIPNIRAVYPAFKEHLQFSLRPIDEVVDELELYSRYYEQCLFPNKCEDKVIRTFLDNFNYLRVNVVRPVILELFDDHFGSRILDLHSLREILRLFESYVVRRAIVGIPTNTLNKTFATFLRQVDKDDYLNSVKRIFLSLDRSRRFPAGFDLADIHALQSDDEFGVAFRCEPLYWRLSSWRLKFVLHRIENYRRKEPVDTNVFSIEHILPQNENLRPEWKEMLGESWSETWDTWVHNIGNLTLTGYNSEMSDRPFDKKRDIEGGFASSPLWLNRGLGQLERWTKEQMVARRDRLYCRALQIWPYPQLDA